MSTFVRQALSASALLACLAVTATSATANPAAFDATHPRRAEVNQRLANQNQRIDAKVATGQIAPAKAARLHQADHQIRQEERDMAAQNGGHLTRQEQKTLNQQENAVSAKIAH